LQIEDGVGRVSLQKERLLGRQLDDSPPQPSARKKRFGIKGGFFQLNHLNCLLPDTFQADENSVTCAPAPVVKLKWSRDCLALKAPPWKSIF
jgi:hypothetical protein